MVLHGYAPDGHDHDHDHDGDRDRDYGLSHPSDNVLL